MASLTLIFTRSVGTLQPTRPLGRVTVTNVDLDDNDSVKEFIVKDYRENWSIIQKHNISMITIDKKMQTY